MFLAILLSIGVLLLIVGRLVKIISPRKKRRRSNPIIYMHYKKL